MEEFEALFKPEIQNSLLTDPDDEYDERLQLRATQVSFNLHSTRRKLSTKSLIVFSWLRSLVIAKLGI